MSGAPPARPPKRGGTGLGGTGLGGTGLGGTGLGGIVLAGGAGRRFGGGKPAAAFAGRTLVERAVAILHPHCRTLIVVGRPDVPLPELDVPVHLDRPGPRAAMNGLATGLAALRTDDVLVLACDLPGSGPVVDRLAGLAPGTAAAARDPAGRWQPLCARYPRIAALGQCERLLAGRELALHALVAALEAGAVDAPADQLANVNEPDDLDDLDDLAHVTPPPPPAGC
jgi:molybdopterin-guanine dinucleotide biosynthesis protein A